MKVDLLGSLILSASPPPWRNESQDVAVVSLSAPELWLNMAARNLTSFRRVLPLAAARLDLHAILGGNR
jgi:hypothetical protein